MPIAIFDLDGVIHVGPTLLPHVHATLDRLRRGGWEVVFATNGTTRTRDGYRDRLSGLGLTIGSDRIVTGASVTADHLRDRRPAPRDVLVVGTDGFRAELRSGGLSVRPRSRDAEADMEQPRPDVVVVGLDPEFDYATLAEAQLAVVAGADLVAGNRDSSYPDQRRSWPGAGAMVAAIEAATGRAATCVGKPEPHLFIAAARIARSEGPVIVVGDSLGSDMVAAHRAGFTAVLVLTGLTTAADVRSAAGEAAPDRVISSLEDLFGIPELSGT